MLSYEHPTIYLVVFAHTQLMEGPAKSPIHLCTYWSCVLSDHEHLTIAGRALLQLVQCCWWTPIAIFSPSLDGKKPKPLVQNGKSWGAILGGLRDLAIQFHDFVDASTNRTICRAHWVDHKVFLGQSSLAVPLDQQEKHRQPFLKKFCAGWLPK